MAFPPRPTAAFVVAGRLIGAIPPGCSIAINLHAPILCGERHPMNDNDKQPRGDGGNDGGNGGGSPWMKSLLIWVGILLALGLFVTMFDGRTSAANSNTVAYSKFLDQIDEGTVKDVAISRDMITGTYTSGEKFRTYPISDPTLVPHLRQKNVTISAKPDEGTSVWMVLLYQSLPFLLFLGIAFFVIKQMQKNTGGGAMGFGKSRARMLTQKEGKVTFDDVAGIDEARAELTEIVDFLKDPSKFARLGGKIPKGALLVGSPGTGKTLLARAIAGEAGVPFFTISGSDFVEMFVGVGASRVRDMFEQAKKSAPCIVFIDEIDAVGRHRGAGLGNGNDEREQTLNQLLVEMDGFEASAGIVIIAATNRQDVLDPALLRPGRLDRHVHVGLPDRRGREQILAVHTRRVPVSTNVDLSVVARSTPGFSGAELANIVNEAALFAARKDKKLVEMDDFEDAKDKIIMGPERQSAIMPPEELENTAYHESGHAVIAEIIPGMDPVHKVTIIPRGRALGVTMQLPEKDRYSNNKTQLLNQIAMLFGGRVAEELFTKEISTGASNDFQRATDIARRMVCEWGMSELGVMVFASEQGEVFMGRSMGGGKTISEGTQLRIDAEIQRILKEQYERATKILTDNEDKVKAMTKALLDIETIDMAQIKDIMAGRPIGAYDERLQVANDRRDKFGSLYGPGAPTAPQAAPEGELVAARSADAQA